MSTAIQRTDLPLPLLLRGKVRDVYVIDDERVLFVATDRISAFDVVLSQPIPDKGAVLTQLTAWWLARLGDLTAHHLISADPDTIAREVRQLRDTRPIWEKRSM